MVRYGRGAHHVFFCFPRGGGVSSVLWSLILTAPPKKKKKKLEKTIKTSIGVYRIKKDSRWRPVLYTTKNRAQNNNNNKNENDLPFLTIFFFRVRATIEVAIFEIFVSECASVHKFPPKKKNRQKKNRSSFFFLRSDSRVVPRVELGHGNLHPRISSYLLLFFPPKHQFFGERSS